MNLKSETPEPEVTKRLDVGETGAISNAIDLANQNLKVFDPKVVKESELYAISQSVVECPELVGNFMFDKMKARLNAFYILNEKYKMLGPTPQQIKYAKDSGYTFEY